MQQHRQTTNFEEILPNLVLFNLKQLEDFGVIKTATAKKVQIDKHNQKPF